MRLRLGEREFDLERRCLVMAIVNRTPDSFYDPDGAARVPGVQAVDDAVGYALAQVAAGADIIDVGGVKAGPGEPVTLAEELDRVMPFIEAFRARSDATLSVDTFRAEVAAAGLDAGAQLVNDVSGMVEREIADVVATSNGAALVVTHAGGQLRGRPFRPVYRPDVTTVVVAELRRMATEAQARGVAREQLVVDPGHDFGKNTVQSLEVTRRLPEICALGYPVLVALSRKDFLGETIGLDIPPSDRLEPSLAAAAAAVHLGARIVRVHDTAATVRVVRTVEAILGHRQPAVSARGLD